MDNHSVESSQTLTCPRCGREFEAGTQQCHVDGNKLSRSLSDPIIGTVLSERYEINSYIGKGGECVVYKGRHQLMNRIVAIKMLHSAYLSDERRIQRFQKEAESASRLSHSNVVGVHDFGVNETGRPYLVMDYIEGESLQVVLDRDISIAPQRLISIIIQVCDGLAEAHERDIVHRDLKPSNIMLSARKDGTELARIVDFGMATMLPSEGEVEQQQKLTRAGEVVGTTLYMSPEQCRGKQLDARSDVYALGCVMYESLTGKTPITGDDFLETMQKHVFEIPVRLNELRSDISFPNSVEDVVMKCLKKDPSERFSDVRELKKSLQACESDLDNSYSPKKKSNQFARSKTSAEQTSVLPASGQNRSVTGKQSESQNRKMAIVVTCVIWILLGAGGFYLFHRSTHYNTSAGSSVSSVTAKALKDDKTQAVISAKNWDRYQKTAQEFFNDGKFADAEKELKLALTEAEGFGPGDRRLILSLRKLGDLYYAEGKDTEAEALDKRISNIKNADSTTSGGAGNPLSSKETSTSAAPKSSSNETDDDVSDRMASIAAECHKNGQCDTAEKLFLKSVKISSTVYGADSLETAARLDDLAAFYMGVGESKKADPLIKKVMRIRAKHAKSAGGKTN